MMRTIDNSRGQSLISVLVAVGVMGVVLVGIASMQTTQSRENRALMEKIASAELARALITTLNRPTSCNMMFSKTGNVGNPGSLSFTDSPGSFPFTVSLKSIPFDSLTDAVSLSSPAVSTLSQSLQVKPGGISVEVKNATSGLLHVEFDQSKLVRPIANLTFPITIATTTSGGTKSISGCVSEGAAAVDAPCPVEEMNYGVYMQHPAYFALTQIPEYGAGGAKFMAKVGPCEAGVVVTDGKAPFGTRCESTADMISTGPGRVVVCMAGKWVETARPVSYAPPQYPGGN